MARTVQPKMWCFVTSTRTDDLVQDLCQLTRAGRLDWVAIVIRRQRLW